PFFFFGRPFCTHSMKNTCKTIFSLQISEQILESLIIGKKMQPFRNGQSVAGSDQQGVCFSYFFCCFFYDIQNISSFRRFGLLIPLHRYRYFPLWPLSPHPSTLPRYLPRSPYPYPRSLSAENHI